MSPWVTSFCGPEHITRAIPKILVINVYVVPEGRRALLKRKRPTEHRLVPQPLRE